LGPRLDSKSLGRLINEVHSKMKALFLFFVACFDFGICGNEADKAFGFTNFKIKLKSDHGVINRNLMDKVSRVDIYREERKVNSESKRNEKKIPVTFILNERFKNPKFVSRNPKRRKLSKNLNSLTNEISDDEKSLFVEKKAVKRPLRRQKNNKKLSTLNHANILNTNFRFAFLKRMKHKLETSNDTEPSADPAKPRTFRKRTRKVKRIRKKLK